MNADELYAVLMSVHDDTLLLPNAAVAEVLARDALQPASGGPDWLAGFCDWNHKRVPVVRFEVLNGGERGGDPRRERIVVLHSLGRHVPGGHIGFVAMGYPHLVTLNRSALRPMALDRGDVDEFVLSRVRIASQIALIPDLEAVEARIAGALAAA
ncbi:chemotaxis protein CheW [Sinimarinibacterium thermocellulolyticum]|uniref:Chemotaxis protein CheW n=1 Tax=Sinimarinibacterium thermocellulolyticum TaxID=3170016 RepID=A0ABV2AB49_9GAMM